MEILIPIDCSAYADSALDFVASRTTLLGLDPEVQLLNVQPWRRRIDVLVTGSHGRGAFDSLVLGSVAMRVAARCHKPLLLIRHKRTHARE